MFVIKTVLIPLFFALVLGACSSDTDFGLGNGGPDPVDTPDPDPDPVTPSVDLALGTGSGSTFVEKAMASSIASGAVLSYGGNATFTVNVVDANSSNALYGTPTTVLFSSACATAGLSTIGASGVSSGGVVSVSYAAKSCQGSDTVTATLESGATASITFGISSLDLGTGSGDSFTSGVMTTTVGDAALSYGGDTAVSVNIVDALDNSLYSDSSVTVSFTSNCVESGLSTIDSTVIARNGKATAAYSAKTCSGTDIITATLPDGTTATASISVADQIFGFLEFVSASPVSIALKGSGSSAHPEVSKLTFLLRDNTGAPIQGETVSYTLSTTVGGITLSNDSSVTANDGTTSVTLNAGGVNVSVSVKAKVTDSEGKSIETDSNSISIVGGLADQDSFSIAVETFNPHGWDFDGVSSSITVRAADRFNNPAPDSTQISFVTNGGSIVGACTLDNGTCSVNWTSQNPRPVNVDINGDGDCDWEEDGDVCGLVKILARTTGEEAFTDTNSNGKYDIGEPIVKELSEAFRDDNNNGLYDLDLGEFYSDFNEDGVYTPKAAGGLFQGSNCSAAAFAAGHCASLVDVRASAMLCMSSAAVEIEHDAGDSIDLSAGSATVKLSAFSSDTGLRPAFGTKINVSIEGGEGGAKIASGGGEQKVPNLCLDPRDAKSKYIFYVGLVVADTSKVAGSLQITVTQADGTIVFGSIPITVPAP